jgi:hypothetical protein
MHRNLIALPSHPLYALQPLDVSCFKPFKTTLKKKDMTMARNNHKELEKIILARWVDKVLGKSLNKQNIRLWFKVTTL